MFEGASYSYLVFSWRQPVGNTDVEFLDSSKLGEKYENNIFVGDINGGNLYYFEVNEGRDALVLEGGFSDRVVDNDNERLAAALGG